MMLKKWKEGSMEDKKRKDVDLDEVEDLEEDIDFD